MLNNYGVARIGWRRTDTRFMKSLSAQNLLRMSFNLRPNLSPTRWSRALKTRNVNPSRPIFVNPHAMINFNTIFMGIYDRPSCKLEWHARDVATGFILHKGRFHVSGQAPAIRAWLSQPSHQPFKSLARMYRSSVPPISQENFNLVVKASDSSSAIA